MMLIYQLLSYPYFRTTKDFSLMEVKNAEIDWENPINMILLWLILKHREIVKVELVKE